MDRLRGALIAGAVAAGVAGCGGPPMQVVSRGTLAYAAAWRGEHLLTIELAERFELVVHDGGLRPVARIDLGPPELDLPALAVTGDVAVVGGRDGWIRRIDLATRTERDRWPQGAAITALAADAELVIAGDAGGAVCVRRTTGELLQCLARRGPIARLTVTGDRLTVVAGDGGTSVLSLPALRPVDEPGAAVRWRGGAVRWKGSAVAWDGPQGTRRLATLAGRVRAVAASAAGKLAIAGWVQAGQLDQPSVVVWTAPPR